MEAILEEIKGAIDITIATRNFQLNPSNGGDLLITIQSNPQQVFRAPIQSYYNFKRKLYKYKHEYGDINVNMGRIIND